jgi:hypothetical protein
MTVYAKKSPQNFPQRIAGVFVNPGLSLNLELMRIADY